MIPLNIRLAFHRTNLHKKVHLSQKHQEWVLAYACLSLWFIGFLVLHFGSMIYSLLLSFFHADMLSTPQFIGFLNYRDLFSDTIFIKSLGITSRYALMAVPLGVILSIFIALMLNEKIPGRALWRTLYYLPSVVSGIAVAILWGWMFNPRIGLINSGLKIIGIQGPAWLASEQWALPALIIMSLWAIGGNMLLYLAGLQSIPTELYEAAKIDGANAIHRFLNITIPMLSPTLFFTTVMGIISAFQLFTEPYVMTKGGPNNATLTTVLQIYRVSFEQFNFGYASAQAWVLFVIILICTMFVFRSSALWVFYEAELKK